MKDDLLPIGTVVIIKNGVNKVFVSGFKAKVNSGKCYDYVGFPYPEGFISREMTLLFNHEQIDKIYYMGYVDEEEKKFKKWLSEEK